MITAFGEDRAFDACMGCPVPKVASDAFCNMLKGQESLERGNLCLLREIERRSPGILKLRKFSPNPYPGHEEALERRRKEILDQEKS